MRTRTALASSLVVVALAGALAPAAAAPPKGFTKTVTYTDGTPDPTGFGSGSNETHCKGVLPMEAPIEVKVPAAGIVEIAMSGFQGDWSLMLTDAKGEVLGGADVNPPDFEVASVKLKRAGTVNVHPCNFAGTPQATVKITYTPKK